jgi:hypothetical protein
MHKAKQAHTALKRDVTRLESQIDDKAGPDCGVCPCDLPAGL